MDKILRSRRSSAVVGGMKNRMITQNRQKSNAKQTKKKLISHDIVFLNLVFNVISMVMTYILLLLSLI